MSGCQRVAPLLDGHHDGELAPLDRFRVRRHLARCEACRDELAGLGRVGGLVRTLAGPAPALDLWRGIEARLPGLEVERQRSRAARTPSRAGLRATHPRGAMHSRRRRFAVPLAAGAALAASLAGAFVLRPELFATSAFTVVRSLNAHGRPVLVLDGASDDATIIWLMEDERRGHPEETSSVWI